MLGFIAERWRCSAKTNGRPDFVLWSGRIAIRPVVMIQLRIFTSPRSASPSATTGRRVLPVEFFALTGSDIGDFALRGGKIRLLCSPEMEKEDIEAIREGSDAIERGDDALRREIARVLEHPHAASGAEILAALYVADHLEIRLAVPSGDGIFHDKFGIFHDPYGNLRLFRRKHQ